MALSNKPLYTLRDYNIKLVYKYAIIFYYHLLICTLICFHAFQKSMYQITYVINHAILIMFGLLTRDELPGKSNDCMPDIWQLTLLFF